MDAHDIQICLPELPNPPKIQNGDLTTFACTTNQQESAITFKNGMSREQSRSSMHRKSFEFPSENPDEITLKNCPKFSDAMGIMQQPWFFDKFNQHPKAFMIKIEANYELCAEYFLDIPKIFENFKKSSIMILFENSSANSQLFWKCGSEKIYSLNFSLDIAEFVLNFFKSSIKFDEHSGISLDTVIDTRFSLDKICHLDLFGLADLRDCNLLMLAAEHGDADAVEFLLRYGFDVNALEADKTAIDLAWDNKHFHVVLQLLKANSLFPENFNFKEATDELKAFTSLTRLVHNCIKDRRIEDLEDILERNQNLRHFYTTKNISAAAKAAIYGNLEIYDLLMSFNVFIGPKEDITAILRKLDEDTLESMRGINLKHIQNWTEKHLMILATNSFVGHDIPDVDEKLEHVTKAYKYLDDVHPLISLILKVVAASRDFKVIFDFQRDSVQYLDPTASRHTKGIYHTTRHIYVAAKQLLDPSTILEGYGTLIHELSHYAMHLVYHNNCRPYCNADDDESASRFSAIAFLCQLRSHKEDLIAMVFGNYSLEMQHAELIVRVPHMLVEYSNNCSKLNENRQTFYELFEYFEAFVAVDMESSLPNIEIAAEEQVLKFAHRTKKQKRQIFRLWFLSGFLMISMPFLVWLVMWIVVEPPEPIYNCKNLTDELRNKIFSSTVDFQGVNVIFSDLFGSDLEACETLESFEISSMLKVYDTGEFVELDIPITNLGIKSSTDAQNSTDMESKVVENYKSRKFLLPSLKIGNKVNLKTNFYVERHISRQDSNWDNNMKPIEFNELKTMKLLLLSDGPGSGKSTVFRHMARRLKHEFPLRWVSYIDLKLYFNELKEVPIFKENDKNLTKVINFLTSKIFKLTSKSDLKIFNEKFTKNNSIFLWDGLDEVSPFCTFETLHLIEFISNFTDNIQWISTRPSFEKITADKFRVDAFKLAPYDEENRKEFITKFLELQKVSPENATLVINRILKFAARLEKQGTDSLSIQMVNSPLMLNMICKSYSTSPNLDNSTNLYEFFEFYVNQLFDIVQNEKGEVVLNDTKRIERQEMFREIHQYFAVSQYMVAGYLTDVMSITSVDTSRLGILKLKLQWSPEEISRYGILFPDLNATLEFDHRTLKEFFIAQYFHDNIWNLKYGRVSQNEARLRLLIIFSMVLDGDRNFKVILDFISGFIHNDKYFEFNEEIQGLMLDEFKGVLYLLRLFPQKIDYLTKFFGKDRKIINCLWKTTENTTLFLKLLNRFSTEHDIDEIMSVVERNFNPQEAEYIFQGKHQAINILYVLWSNLRGQEFAEKLINVTKFDYESYGLSYEFLVNQELNSNMEGNEENFQEDERLVCDETTPETIDGKEDNSAKHQNRTKCSHSLLKIKTHPKSLKSIKNVHEFLVFMNSKNFSYSEIREFFLAHSMELTTSLISFEIFKYFWTNAENHLNPHDLEEMLMQKDEILKETLLFRMQNKDLKVIEFFFKFFENHLKSSKIEKLLVQKRRNTSTNFIIYFFENNPEQPKGLNMLWNFTKRHMKDTNKLKEMREYFQQMKLSNVNLD